MAPYPHQQLGVRWDGTGIHVAVFSHAADAIELCLHPGIARLEERISLERVSDHWYGYVPGVEPGAMYGFRAHGRKDPSHGLRFDAAKLLVDPYARAVHGSVQWGDALLAPGVDSATLVPHSVVTTNLFDWGEDHPPRIPWSDTVIYEAHVKGMTQTHPSVPAAIRGTYAGLAHPAVIDSFRTLGVTAVELLPVQEFASEERLQRLGLSNYWGYNSLAWFAPHGAYSSAGSRGHQVTEFKAMVAALHQAGIEVILDVVYNHTAEGGNDGPTLSLRGLDNAAYYRLAAEDPSRYSDVTGCGNTLNVDNPAALRLVLDSLRHWVTDYHVDGFRFDLAVTLGRDRGEFDPGAAFFDAIWADPVLNSVKLIAEPWDVGPGGYQVGQFPNGWSEWNDQFRNVARDFWRGEPNSVAPLAGALSGSASTFARAGRGPHASINFVACHDGFTLADLVSYERKHNEANGEDNRDGTNDNRSGNWGVEGPTEDQALRSLRSRLQRNFLATVVLAAGVPMVGAGDELGRSQRGNNNAYCQDNEMSWIDWEDLDATLRVFTSRLFALRRRYAVLRSTRWANGEPRPADGVVDLAWFDLRGHAMGEGDWNDRGRHSVAFCLDGRSGHGTPTTSLYVIINGEGSRSLARVPEGLWPGSWQKVLDTADPVPGDRHRHLASGERIRLEARSLAVLAGAALWDG